jgi:gamma-glutamylcyclotransferase (GGCT)/AIG2-like uncharacterized protein YtfP
VKYAAYGSNLHPVRLQERTGDVQFLGCARVEGLNLRWHKRGNLDGSGKCNIVDCEDGVVHMAVFEVPDAGMEALDIVEGVGAGYERAWVEIEDFGRCLTYRAQQSHIEDGLAPFGWYKDLVLAGCQFHGFPDDYVQTIEAIEAVADAEPDRHALHEELLRNLT